MNQEKVSPYKSLLCQLIEEHVRHMNFQKLLLAFLTSRIGNKEPILSAAVQLAEGEVMAERFIAGVGDQADQFVVFLSFLYRDLQVFGEVDVLAQQDWLPCDGADAELLQVDYQHFRELADDALFYDCLGHGAYLQEYLVPVLVFVPNLQVLLLKFLHKIPEAAINLMHFQLVLRFLRQKGLDLATDLDQELGMSRTLLFYLLFDPGQFPEMLLDGAVGADPSFNVLLFLEEVQGILEGSDPVLRDIEGQVVEGMYLDIDLFPAALAHNGRLRISKQRIPNFLLLLKRDRTINKILLQLITIGRQRRLIQAFPLILIVNVLQRVDDDGEQLVGVLLLHVYYLGEIAYCAKEFCNLDALL